MNSYNGYDNSGTLWDASDLQYLIKLYNHGNNMETIGRCLGRSPAACAERIRMIKMGLLLKSNDPAATIYDVKLSEIRI